MVVLFVAQPMKKKKVVGIYKKGKQDETIKQAEKRIGEKHSIGD